MKFLKDGGDAAIRTVGILIGGLGLGAALMYVLDPERGRRRRALVRDKAVRAVNRASDTLGARSRDWRNRARGVASRFQTFREREVVEDPVLEERVRAELGRAVSDAGAIDVTALDGNITLAGRIAIEELDALLSAVRGVSGVVNVENRLEMGLSPGEFPEQEGVSRSRRKAESPIDRWEPAEVES